MSVGSLVLIADSRSYGFSRYNQPEELQTFYVVKRGAKIQDLTDESLDKIKQIRSDIPLIVKIACGINNLTHFVYHSGGKELTESACTTIEVIGQFQELKRKIKQLRPDSLVGFITIPGVSLEKCNKHLSNRGLLSQPRNKGQILDSTQRSINEKLDEVNKWIKATNSCQQEGHNRGCRTVSWHNSILKRSKVKRQNNNYKIVYRRNYKQLYDGLHAVSDLKKKWFWEVTKAAIKESKYTSKEKAVEASSSSDTDTLDLSWDFKRPKRN